MGEYDGVAAAVGVAVAITTLIILFIGTYIVTGGMVSWLKITDPGTVTWAPITAAVLMIVLVGKR